MAMDNEAYSKIISALVTTLNKFSLYPPEHPLIKSHLAQAHSLLSEFLGAKKELTFSLSSEDKILVEGQAVTNVPSGLLSEFVLEFKKLQAESITFSEGLSAEELHQFIKIMLAKADDIKNKDGISKILAEKEIKHIHVNIFSYIKIDKEKEVVTLEKDQLKTQGLSFNISLLLQDKIEGSLLEAAKGQIQRSFLESPQGVLDVVKDAISNIERLSRVLDILGESLADDSSPKEVKSQIEILKSLAKFSSQVKKLSAQLEDKDNKEKINSLIDQKSAKFSEEILIQAAVAEFMKKKAWAQVLTGVMKKLFKTDDLNRITSGIKDRIARLNLPQQEIDNFVIAMQESLAQGLPEKTSRVSKKELESLRNENQQLKASLAKLQKEANGLEELKKRHRQIVCEKERVDNIIHNMAEGLVVVDAQGKVLLVNPAAEKLLGSEKNQLLGNPLRQNIKEEHLLTVTKNMPLEGEGNLNSEIELLSPDESTKRVLKTSSAVIENQDGKTVGMVTVLNDITRQKEVEKLKSDFVANVSHELRTPLAVIQHSLELLSSEVTDKLSQDQQRFLINAENNLNRLRILITDLLDMSSIEAGKFKLKFGMYDINEVAKNVIDFLDKWAKTKNIALELSPLPSVVELNIDKDRIIQVITNLVSNAIKFTLAGGKVAISLSMRAPDADKPSDEYVEVAVIDNGIGIEEKDLERIFVQFEQVSLVQPPGVGGTGLGLPIAKEIIQMHKGKIWVESQIGKGSKFAFIIPKNSLR